MRRGKLTNINFFFIILVAIFTLLSFISDQWVIRKEDDLRQVNIKYNNTIELMKNIYDNIQDLRFEFKYIKAHTNLSDEHSMGNAKADQLATNSLKKY